MTTTPSTVDRQGPTALLALVQHIHTHGLGTPLSIEAPSIAAPHFRVTVASFSLPAWLDRGFVVDEQSTHPIGGGRINGDLYERVTVDGRLADLGIRVRLNATRRVNQPLTVVSA